MSREQLIFLSLMLCGCALLLVSIKGSKKREQLEKFNLSTRKKPQESRWSGMAQVLNRLISSDQKEIDNKLLAAGFYDLKWSRLFMPAKYAVLLLGCAGWFGAGTLLEWQTTSILVAIALWLVVVLIAPDSYLALRARSLTHTISAKLPYMLDLMAVCVQTGMTIEASISYLAREMAAFDRDLSYLLTRVNDRSRIIGLERALDELYQRVPSNEMRSFVMTLNQSLHYGSSIYGVLTTLSADIREVQLLHVEEKIGKLAAKMSIPLILFIMIPIVILIAAPGVMRMLGNV